MNYSYDHIMEALRESYRQNTGAPTLSQQAREIAARIRWIAKAQDKIDQIRANPYILIERVPGLSQLVAPAPFFVDDTPIEPIILESVRDLKTQILEHTPGTPFYLSPTEVKGAFGVGYTTMQLDTLFEERRERKAKNKTLVYSRFGTDALPLQIAGWTRTSKLSNGGHRIFESRAIRSFGDVLEHRVSTTYEESGTQDTVVFEGITVKDILGGFTGMVASIKRLHGNLEGFVEVSYEYWKMGIGRDAPTHENVVILLDLEGNVYARETRDRKGNALTHDTFAVPTAYSRGGDSVSRLISRSASRPKSVSGPSDPRGNFAEKQSRSTSLSKPSIPSQPAASLSRPSRPSAPTPAFFNDVPVPNDGHTPVLGTPQEFLVQAAFATPQKADTRHQLTPLSQWPGLGGTTVVDETLDSSAQIPNAPRNYTTRVLIAEPPARRRDTRPLPPLNQISKVRNTNPLPDLPDLEAVPMIPAISPTSAQLGTYSAPYTAPQPYMEMHFYGNQELGAVAFWEETPAPPRHSGSSMTLGAARRYEETEPRQSGGGPRQRVNAHPLTL